MARCFLRSGSFYFNTAMSRIGKKPIVLNDKTTAVLSDNTLTVTGPAGSISRTFKPEITITVTDKLISLEPKRKSLDIVALWGTYSSHISNMVDGVNTPYKEILVIEGIGYKADVKGDKLVMGLGFSHPVAVQIPEGIKLTTEKNLINISGVDKEKVGQFTAQIRAMKKPEPYKGKGIMYQGEIIRRKQGKKTV